MSHMPLLAGTGWDTGQERNAIGVSFEISSGEQRLLISDVFETFPHFLFSILKVDTSSGFGYLQVLLTQGARAVHCNTISYLQHRAASSRRRAGAWKGTGVT